MKAVWRQAFRSSFAPEFGDATQLQMVRTLDQNFSQIKNVLGANTVVVRLMDQDACCGQYGGGFSYNPASDPAEVIIDYGDGTAPFPVPTRPDFMLGRSVAQEIILSIAQKHGLDVVFAIELSGYHVNIEDLDQYENPAGAYAFMNRSGCRILRQPRRFPGTNWKSFAVTGCTSITWCISVRRGLESACTSPVSI